MKKGKIVLVGTGFVGISMAYSMLNRGGINELVLIDLDENKAIGEEMDLSHGLPFAPQKMVIKAGNYSDCKDAQIVVITAGAAQKPGQTRLELAEVNTKIMKSITEQIMASGFNGIIINITNPCDIIAYYIQKTTGLPKNKVFGTGTGLDSSRFKNVMAQATGIDHKSIIGYSLGEHGDSQMIPWSIVNLGGKPLSQLEKERPETFGKLDKEDIKNMIL